jgi:hypothetical protein
MNYFQYQDITPYEYLSPEGVPQLRAIVNITERAKIAERLRQYTTVMYDYVIADGERPDSVATRVYGDPKYTWVVLLVNNIMSLYDWPLSYEEFESYIIAKYGSIQAANEGTRTYFRADGVQVDALTYDSLLPEDQGEIRTPLEQETLDNEAKRRIKVIAAQFLPGIDQAIKTLYRA